MIRKEKTQESYQETALDSTQKHQETLKNNEQVCQLQTVKSTQSRPPRYTKSHVVERES